MGKESQTTKPAKKAASKSKTTEKSPVVVKPEEQVLIMACLNPQVAKAATDSARDNKVEVVVLEDKVIYDYLQTKSSKGGQNERDRVAEFLQNQTNRLFAEQQAIRLFTIVTGNTDLSGADERVFTENEVVRKTSLSHSQAQKLFDVLRAFGILEFTQPREFKLHFTREARHQTILKEIESVAGILHSDILRLRTSLLHDDSITAEKRADWENKISEVVKTALA